VMIAMSPFDLIYVDLGSRELSWGRSCGMEILATLYLLPGAALTKFSYTPTFGADQHWLSVKLNNKKLQGGKSSQTSWPMRASGTHPVLPEA